MNLKKEFKEYVLSILNDFSEKKEDVISLGVYISPQATDIGLVYNTKENLEARLKEYEKIGKKDTAFVKWDMNEWKMNLPDAEKLNNWLEEEIEDLDDDELSEHVIKMFEMIVGVLLDLKTNNYFNDFPDHFFISIYQSGYWFDIHDGVAMLKLLGIKKYGIFYNEYVSVMCETY